VRLLAGVIIFAVLGVVGNMDRHDQEAAEQFRREWMTISDESGCPQLVPRHGIGRGSEFGESFKDQRRGISGAVQHLSE
jgi:hypothetical protein